MRETQRSRRRATRLVDRVGDLVRDEPDEVVRLLVFSLIETRKSAFPGLRIAIGLEPYHITEPYNTATITKPEEPAA